jgi:hypothetical protein
LGALALFTSAAPPVPKAGPQYTADAQVKFPADYRERIFLSSGVGMTYGPLARPGPPQFDNVFVNPDSYRAFLRTGHWPDKTMFILEVRASESHGSINNGGHFQTDITGIEAEVKDGAAWTFYGFSLASGAPSQTAKAIPRTASCYSCHRKNTAVENTFVQFYPQLYEIAERKGTLNPGFERLPISVGKLFQLIQTEGWPKGATALAQAAAQSPDAAVLAEPSLNSLAARLIQADRPNDAVSLAEWATARYPQSSALQETLSAARVAAKSAAK